MNTTCAWSAAGAAICSLGAGRIRLLAQPDMSRETAAIAAAACSAFIFFIPFRGVPGDFLARRQA
jgi:hypothetical protein